MFQILNLKKLWVYMCYIVLTYQTEKKKLLSFYNFL